MLIPKVARRTRTCIALTSLICIWALCSASTFSTLNIDFLGSGGKHGLVAGPDHTANLRWNPSGLGYDGSEAAYASYMDYMVDVKGGAAGYVGSAGPVGYGL